MKKFFLSLVLISIINISSNNSATAVPQTDVIPQTQNEIIRNELTPANSNNDITDIPKEKKYSQAEYEQIYQDLEVPSFSFLHGVDPDQYYDMKDTAWSPYPLMRLNSPIYFKSITILPGYYLLTPRQYKGDWYVLFKEAGKVRYTIPVFERNFTEPLYYRNNLKEIDYKSRSQKWMIKFLDGVGRVFKKSKRRPPIKTNLELTDLDNKFLLIEVYYGSYRYKTIFRVEKF